MKMSRRWQLDVACTGPFDVLCGGYVGLEYRKRFVDRLACDGDSVDIAGNSEPGRSRDRQALTNCSSMQGIEVVLRCHDSPRRRTFR